MTDEARTYLDPYEHLQDKLGLVLLYLQRYVGRHSHRMLQADGRLSDLYVSLAEAQRFFAAAPGPWVETRLTRLEEWPILEELGQQIEAHQQGCDTRLSQAMGALGQELPLEQLRGTFRLSPVEIELLVAAASPSISVDIGRLMTFAWADFAQKAPSVAFLTELVAETHEDVRKLVESFVPDAPLVRNRLVVIEGDEKNPSLLAKTVRVPEAVIALLRGHPRPLVEVCGEEARVLPAQQTIERGEIVLPPQCLSAMEGALRRSFQRRKSGLGLALVGPPSVGRGTALASLVAELGFEVMEIDLCELAKRESPAEIERALAEMGREATIKRCVVLLRGDELWEDGGELAELMARAIERRASALGVMAALTCLRLSGPLQRFEDRTVKVAFEATTSKDQAALWAKALEHHKQELNEDLIGVLTDGLDAPAGAIWRSVTRAARDASGAQISRNEILAAHGEHSAHRLHEIAEPFKTSSTWEDLVLPDEILALLQEVIVHSRHRDQVFGQWGFNRKISYGKGLSCLFAGPPGTGKTMTAGLLANILQRPLFRIDLSRVMSKWVGETEKNLAKVFDEAARSNVILLFDEADSLFGSRTEVKSANDRYANLEVNYLLQRMEQYDGITILTTNFDKGIDEAFKRRIRFRITFPFPKVESRERLWRAMLPKEAPVADDIDFDALAADFELAGGSIKNAVLRAAFQAARQDLKIGHKHLNRAAILEAKEMGLLVRNLVEEKR